MLYSREPFRDAVKRITDGRGADVVFDPVGGEIFENSVRCIAWGARLLVVGFTGGIGLARTNLLLIKGASVLGVRAGEAVRKNPALGEVRLKALTEWAEAGQHPAEHLAPAAAGEITRRRCGFDRPQGDRPGGADDGVRSRSRTGVGWPERDPGHPVAAFDQDRRGCPASAGMTR